MEAHSVLISSGASQIKEVYELLTHHYVEDMEAMFRFNYSEAFLNWYCIPCPLTQCHRLTFPGH